MTNENDHGSQRDSRTTYSPDLYPIPEEKHDVVRKILRGGGEVPSVPSNVVHLNTVPPNLKCSRCGSEWWNIVGTFDQKLRIISGYQMDMRCNNCGKEEHVYSGK